MQRLRRLLGRRPTRQDERVFVVEGAKLLGEALAAGAPVEAVYVAADRLAELPPLDHTPVHVLAEGVAERVADTVAPQPVLATVGYVDRPLDELAGADFLVVCVDVRDPGNLGTVLRSAEAAGVHGVVCCDGSVDLYNPKAVRASAGTMFHVPVVAGGDPVEVLERIGGWGVRRLATAARGGADYATVDLTGRVAIVLGNEASGLPHRVEPLVDQAVTVPMAGRAESLNVAMAAAVVCFEAARQRRSPGARP